jgi:[ribosomal protein S18]-alanine N-acetyltransferase
MIREARPGDLRRLWELDRICFEPGIAYSRGEIRRFLDQPGARCIVAESGDGIDGFALGYPGPPDLARVVTLDVRPDARRRGLGKELLERLLADLAAAGARRPLLEVDVRNTGAIAFYRTLGFSTTGRIPDYYGPGLDAFEMARAPGTGVKPSPAAPGGDAEDRGTRRAPRGD